MGSHSVNLEGDLGKYRVDKNNKVIEKLSFIGKDGSAHEHAGHAHDQANTLDMDKVKKAFDTKEGC